MPKFPIEGAQLIITSATEITMEILRQKGDSKDTSQMAQFTTDTFSSVCDIVAQKLSQVLQ